MARTVTIALAGVGVIGRRHLSAFQQCPAGIALGPIVDPLDDVRHIADSVGKPWYPSLAEMFSAERPDGVIIATPNQSHVENGLACVRAGCPMLVEKPIASTSRSAETLVAAARSASVPVLVGHHRRHNPLVRKARELIETGQIGSIVMVQSQCWLLKPDSYFEPDWRRQPGAGPTLVNAIHDVDLLRYLCGEVSEVYAVATNRTRGFAVEDSLVATLRFSSGALGTLGLSDTAASPWSWELTSGENPAYPQTRESCYHISGTEGGLSLPQNLLWHHPSNGHWMTPIAATSFPTPSTDPLIAQIEHFAAVIRGEAEPLVSGQEGIRSLMVIEALLRSADLGKPVTLPP